MATLPLDTRQSVQSAVVQMTLGYREMLCQQAPENAQRLVRNWIQLAIDEIQNRQAQAAPPPMAAEMPTEPAPPPMGAEMGPPMNGAGEMMPGGMPPPQY